MAGDWIKVEQATVDKPEVLRLAELLGWDRRHALGLLVEFWCWLDKNLSASCPDFVRNMSAKSLDEVMHVPGFAASLVCIGWAKFDDKAAVMTIINADRHNGNTAKTRALDAKRKKERRLESVPKMSVLKPDKNGTREEKRREDINTSSRASRLADDWALPEDWKAWALREKPAWDETWVLRTAEDFRDYWVAAPKGSKLDWLATWRKWVRNASDPKNKPASDPPWKGAH